MITIRVYPANKEFFIRLKIFCRKILDICEELKITPIAYGGLAYFGYTKKKVTINDIDFLIPENSFEKIIKILAKKKIKHHYSPEWHTLQIFEGGLKIELDSIGYWYKDMPKNFENFDFDGLTVKSVSLEALKALYKRASETSKDKSDEYHKKFNVLKKLK